jgi:thiol-disulfide isomerase/thioredoxin
MRIFCAAMIALALGLYIAYHQTAKATVADDSAAKLKEQKAKYDEEYDELVKRFEKAANTAEKKGILAEAKELATLTAEKVRKIAEDDPKSTTGFDAASFGLGRLVGAGAGGPDIDKLFAIVTEHHINNPKVRDIVLVAGRAGASGEKFLEAAAAKSTDKDVRGISLYILGISASAQSDDTSTEKESTALVKKAVDLLERAMKESPKTKVDGDIIENLCKAEIKSVQLLAIGQPVPALEGTELRDQKKQTTASLKGNVVLLDIWATWCGPCVGMIPHEREMVKRLADKPFKLVSVSVDEKKDTVTKFLVKNEMPWTHWWDDGEENPLIQTLKVRGYPTLYLIDAKGTIRRKWSGVPDPIETLDKAVDELVKEATAAKN